MKDKDKWKRGLPYVGNKGGKAQQILDLLPSGTRLIDPFGGADPYPCTPALVKSTRGSYIMTDVGRWWVC